MLDIVVASGSTASSVFLIERHNHPVAFFVPSASPNTVQVQFSTSSAGPFVSLFNRDASPGFNTTAFSGTNGGVCVVPNVPSPWCRLSFGAALSDVMSVAVMRAGGLM